MSDTSERAMNSGHGFPQDGYQPFDPIKLKRQSLEDSGSQTDVSVGRPSGASDCEKQVDFSAFPNGGAEAWMVVLGAFCAIFASFGWVNCIGLFQNYYQLNQLRSYSPSDISWITSLETCMMFLVAPISGKIFDSYGPRYLLLIASFFHVFGLMMASISTEYYQFLLAQGICSPLGAGTLFFTSISCVNTWFSTKRATALGIAVTGSSLGGVILPTMVQELIPKVGYEWAMRTCAFFILGLCAIANATMKSRLPPNPRAVNLIDFIKPFKEVTFFFTALSVFLFLFGQFLPYNYVIVHARSYGMSDYLAGYLVPIMNATSTLGRTLPGIVADRVGRYNITIIMAFVTTVLVLALWIPAQTDKSILAFAAVYGFSNGALLSLPGALIAQISDVREIGVRTGAMFFFGSIGALTGSPIGGALVPDPQESPFWKLQLFAGLAMAAGSTSLVYARVSATGWKLMEKF